MSRPVAIGVVTSLATLGLTTQAVADPAPSETATQVLVFPAAPAGAGSTFTLSARVLPTPPTAVLSFTIPWDETVCAAQPVDATGFATCTLTAPVKPGIYTVAASYPGGQGFQGSSSSGPQIVSPGPVSQLSLLPGDSSTSAGQSVTYTAAGTDRYGNKVSNYTGLTTFTITPDGSCTQRTCTATTAGPHTVTGVAGDARGTATLAVIPASLDQLSVTPATATISAGTAQDYTAAGTDRYGNSTGDVTSSTAFTIAPDGSCNGASCSATRAGPHTVTATNGTVTASSLLTVTAAHPQGVTATQGDNQTATAGKPFTSPLSVNVTDAYGNPVADAQVTFAIDARTSGTASFGGTSQQVSVITDGAGNATSPPVVAGDSAGSVMVSAYTLGDSGYWGVTFTETVTAAGPARSDLAVSVSAPSTVNRGATATVTVTVTNKGPQAASQLLTGVYVGNGFTVTDAGGGVVRFGTDVLVTPTLASGQKVIYTITVKAGSKKSSNIVTAATGSVVTDPVLANNLTKATITIT